MSLPDISLILAPPKAVEAAWQSSGLAEIPADALRDSSSYELVPQAITFLDTLYHAGGGTAFDGLPGILEPAIDGTTAACFGHDYVLFREALLRSDRDAFDRLFGPFVPAAGGADLIDWYDPEKLRKMGICFLYAPERSGALAELTRVYSMSTLLALLADQGGELPAKIARRLGELTDLESIHWRDVLARYEHLTVLWRSALLCASGNGRLLIGYVE